MDLSAVYKHYASDKLRENIEYDNGYLLQYPTVDNKLYGIPLTSAYEGNIGFMWLRTDWMKQLGLSAPTTYDELCTYIQKVKDSGLNGTSQSSGFSFLGPGSVSFDSIAQISGAYYNYWVKDAQTGKLVYSSVQPSMRNALLAMQKMFANGLIDRDFAVKASTEQEMISNGQYGVLFGQYYYPALLKGSVLNNKNATWNAYPMPSSDGVNPVPKGNTYASAYVVVRKGFEHPEALMKSMSLWGEVWLDGGQYRDWFTEQMTTAYKDVVFMW